MCDRKLGPVDKDAYITIKRIRNVLHIVTGLAKGARAYSQEVPMRVVVGIVARGALDPSVKQLQVRTEFPSRSEIMSCVRVLNPHGMIVAKVPANHGSTRQNGAAAYPAETVEGGLPVMAAEASQRLEPKGSVLACGKSCIGGN